MKPLLPVVLVLVGGACAPREGAPDAWVADAALPAPDASVDDAGASDAGDAGADAGTADAGSDGGVDAGVVDLHACHFTRSVDAGLLCISKFNLSEQFEQQTGLLPVGIVGGNSGFSAWAVTEVPLGNVKHFFVRVHQDGGIWVSAPYDAAPTVYDTDESGALCGSVGDGTGGVRAAVIEADGGVETAPTSSCRALSGEFWVTNFTPYVVKRGSAPRELHAADGGRLSGQLMGVSDDGTVVGNVENGVGGNPIGLRAWVEPYDGGRRFLGTTVGAGGSLGPATVYTIGRHGLIAGVGWGGGDIAVAWRASAPDDPEILKTPRDLRNVVPRSVADDGAICGNGVREGTSGPGSRALLWLAGDHAAIDSDELGLSDVRCAGTFPGGRFILRHSDDSAPADGGPPYWVELWRITVM